MLCGILDVLQAATQKGLPLDALAFEPDRVTAPHVDVSGREIVQAPVVAPGVGNDAKAATLGEWQAGAGQGLQNFVYVTISTGIGSAAVMDGRLLRGKGGLAGEIGHTKISDSSVTCACELTGCWQATASGAGLDLQAQKIARDDRRGPTAQAVEAATPTGVHLGRAAQDGHPTARIALDGHARLLGQGLTNLQHVYSPEVIVMGGGVSALLELTRPTIEGTMRERLLPGFTPALIKGATLGDDAGLIGAALGEHIAP